MIPLVPVLLALSLALEPLQQPPQIPAPTGFVNDFAGVLSSADEARMTRLIEIVRAGSQGEITIVTLADLGGRDVADVALRIGREWGVGAKAAIGDQARNTGVVVLLVPKETSADGRGYISISTGQGTEGFLTDGTTGDIRREATPALSRGAYGEALTLITGRLSERYAAEFGFALDGSLVPKRVKKKGPKIPPAVILFGIIMLINVISMSTKRGRRHGLIVPFPLGRRGGGFGGGFGGGGFGGGGGGFGGFGGGGGFSGGGSSGSF